MRYQYGNTIVESDIPLDSAVFKPVPEKAEPVKPTKPETVKKTTAKNRKAK